jgi:hypothetical protein
MVDFQVGGGQMVAMDALLEMVESPFLMEI